MPESSWEVVVGYAFQALASAVLSGCLLVYGRYHRRPVLRVWGLAFGFLGLGLIGAALAYAGAIRGADASGPFRLATSALNVGGRVLHAVILLMGSWVLVRGRWISRSAWAGVLVVLAVGSALVVLLTAAQSPAVRFLLRVELPSGMMAVATAVAALAVIRTRSPGAGPGAWILGGALAIWTAQQVHTLVADPSWPHYPWVGFMDAAALFLVAVAAVVWFLEAESAVIQDARDQAQEAQASLRRRLEGEEVLQEVSASFVHGGAYDASALMRRALTTLAGHLGAERAFVVDRPRDGLNVVWTRAGVEPREWPGDLDHRTPVPLKGGQILRRTRGDGGVDVLLPCMVQGALAGVVGFAFPPEADELGADDAWLRLTGEVFAGLLARVRIEARSAAALRRLEATFRAFPDAVTVSRVRDGVFLEVNRGFEELTGWSRTDVEGRSAESLGIWADLEQRRHMVGALREKGHVRDLPCDFRMRDGRVRRFLVSAEAVDVEGEPCLVAVSRDRTEVLQLEEELLQAQRLEAVGRLAGGVAHDFNNLLTVVGAYAEILAEATGVDDDVVEAGREILSAQRRGRDLTRRLLAFARRQVVQPTRVVLEEVVAEMATLLERLLGADVELSLDLATDGAAVHMDRTQLEQVLVNLAVNARDAMPAGGLLRIAAERRVLEAVERIGELSVPAGSWVVVSVEDEGVGIPEAHLGSIFDPFFTTKEVGKGTGLGLSTVYGAVQQAGGHVMVESEVGRGTTFVIFLPDAGEEEPAAERAGPDPGEDGDEREPRLSGATILLVEDEPALRTLFRRVLKSEGYDVVEAADGGAALRWLHDHDDPVDLLLTDVVLPGVDGMGVARAFLELRPEALVVFMTGYYDEGRGGLPEPNAGVLRKPFTSTELAAKVREALERRR